MVIFITDVLTYKKETKLFFTSYKNTISNDLHVWQKITEYSALL